MSVSSDSEPPYNEFYDRPAVSDGNSIHDSPLRTRPSKHSVPSISSVQSRGGAFAGLLSSFQSCCLNRGHEHESQRRTLNDTYIDETAEFSEDSETSEEGLPVDVAPKRVIQNKGGRKMSESAYAAKLLLEDHGLSWADLSSTKKLDNKARWIITASLQDVCDSSWKELTQEDREMIALNWCRSQEFYERMSEKLLKQIMSGIDKLRRGYSIQLALDKLDDYATLIGVRHVEARLIEEVMGEFQSAVQDAEKGGTVYLVISNIRTIALSCWIRGDARTVNIFDTGVTRERGPAFLGFDEPEKVENYLSEIYWCDPMVKSSTEKFSAWTIKSKHALKDDSRNDISQPPSKSMPPEIPAWETTELSKDDPDAEANLAYTAMYQATDQPGR